MGYLIRNSRYRIKILNTGFSITESTEKVTVPLIEFVNLSSVILSE